MDRQAIWEISALKLTSGESTGRIIDTCMQIFGAHGYVRTFPLERFWRDARLARLGGGTDEVLSDLPASGLDRCDPETDSRLASIEAPDTPVRGLTWQ